MSSLATEQCQGKTKSGNRCRRTARANGFCSIHDPERTAAAEAARNAAQRAADEQWRQGERLRELLERFTGIAERMGWTAYVASMDRSEWKHFSLEVRRRVSRGDFGSETIAGLVEVVMDKTVRMSSQPTSPKSTGLDLLFKALREEFDNVPWLKPVKKAPEAKRRTPSESVIQVLTRFHQVAVQLSRRREGRETLRINDEYDVQDLLHALLRSRFDDVRPEEYTPSYAGGASRMDFLLKRERVVIEVKLASPTLRDRDVGEQLMVDIQRYQSHPDCRTLFCFVYDPNHELRNPAGLEHDLSDSSGDVEVAVLVEPK